MQIASLIKGAEGQSLKWTGPNVRFYDDGGIDVAGYLSAEQLQHVYDMHMRVNTKSYQRKLNEAASQPVGEHHDPRPSDGYSDAPELPYAGTI